MGNVALKGIECDTQAIYGSPRLTTNLAEAALAGPGPVKATRQRVLFVTPEIADFVKAGGLGDVSSALPRALAAHHDVRILIPAYREVLESALSIRSEERRVGKEGRCRWSTYA